MLFCISYYIHSLRKKLTTNKANNLIVKWPRHGFFLLTHFKDLRQKISCLRLLYFSFFLFFEKNVISTTKLWSHYSLRYRNWWMIKFIEIKNALIYLSNKSAIDYQTEICIPKIILKYHSDFPTNKIASNYVIMLHFDQITITKSIRQYIQK